MMTLTIGTTVHEANCQHNLGIIELMLYRRFKNNAGKIGQLEVMQCHVKLIFAKNTYELKLLISY